MQTDNNIIKNWRYFDTGDNVGELSITKGQYMTGNMLGIIVEKKPIKNPYKNVANAKSYNVSVRIKGVDLYDGTNKNVIEEQIRTHLKVFELEGIRAVITSGGYLGLFDDVLHERGMICLSSPLQMLDFVLTSIAEDKVVGVITSLKYECTISIMHSLGYAEDKINRCFFANSIEQLPINTGAVIVDTSESFESEYGKLDRIPIYDTLRIASFISNAVCQMPYEGGI